MVAFDLIYHTHTCQFKFLSLKDLTISNNITSCKDQYRNVKLVRVFKGGITYEGLTDVEFLCTESAQIL